MWKSWFTFIFKVERSSGPEDGQQQSVHRGPWTLDWVQISTTLLSAYSGHVGHPHTGAKMCTKWERPCFRKGLCHMRGATVLAWKMRREDMQTINHDAQQNGGNNSSCRPKRTGTMVFKRYLHGHFHISIIYNSPKVEKNPRINGKANCGIYIHIHNGILFSPKKGNSETCYKTGEPWGHYAK